MTLTNRQQFFGRDLDFRRSVIVEAGFRRVFGRETVLDVAAYNTDVRSATIARLVRLPDPGEGGSLRDFSVFTNANRGNIRGVDVRLDHRLSNLFSGSLVYTHQSAEETSDIRTHTIAGWAALTLPNDWQAGTRLGTILENTGLFATFRFASGQHYTRLDREGFPSEPLNASALPWVKTVDVRVRRGFRLGRLDATLFAESRNLLNFTNVVDLFTETGDVADPLHRVRFVADQILQLESEAAAEGLLKFDPATQQNYVDFQAADVCTRWSARSGQGGGGPVDCVLLVRAERRFGNGDGLFTRSEFSKAFDAWYDLANAPYRFYGPGRRIRVGAEISF